MALEANHPKMLGLIFELIGKFFIEILFEGVILKMFKSVYWLGVVILKLVTFRSKPIKELKEKYKDSSKPYFIGFGIVLGIIYVLINEFG